MTNEARINKAQLIIPYHFNDREYLIEALQAAGPGTVIVHGQYIPDGNKRLAQLGDSILKTILLQDWYFTNQSRGEGNNLVSEVASNKHLAQLAVSSGLDEYIALNNSQQGQKPSPVLLSATIEAVIGAVWLDSGNNLPATRHVMQSLGLCAENLGNIYGMQ